MKRLLISLTRKSPEKFFNEALKDLFPEDVLKISSVTGKPSPAHLNKPGKIR